MNWNGSLGAVDCIFSLIGGSSRALNKPDNSGDRKQFPGTALAGEPRYRNLVDNARIGIGDVSVDGTIIYANPTALKMFEYDSLDELRKLNVSELWHLPEQREEFISKLRQDGYVNNYEIEYLTRTGTIFTVQASAILDGDMISQVIIDISERKRAEGSLLMSSEIITNVTDAVNVVRAEDGIQIFSNPAFDTMFGYKEDESLGTHLSVLSASTDADAEETAKTISESLEKEGKWEGESLCRKRDGSTFWTSTKIGSFDHPEYGRVWVYSRFDITERKKVEEQLRRSHKMEALGILAGGIAHDINNMLYPIFINAELLLEESDADGKEQAYLHDIVTSARQARDLVSQVLIFGRQTKSVGDTCDFVAVAKDAMKLLRPALPETISITLDLPSSAVPVLCDYSHLYQVVVNLFTNAEHAVSARGNISLTLDTVDIEELECAHGSLQNGSFGRLTVSDNGVGMSDKTRAKIFDPFFTTKEAGKGTGLGLSTVFGIVRDYGGGITISSELGIGSSFGIYIPLTDKTLDEPRDMPVGRADATNTENIIFVDDVESIRRSTKVCLERSGYDVAAVSSGREALEIFLADPDHFDLVITDQTMAEMTGKELSARLLRARPDIPIIICTGHSDHITAENIGEAGIRAYLQKPSSPSELRRVVREVLDEANAGQSSE
jgi:PAS domain S-box-containing protein